MSMIERIVGPTATGRRAVVRSVVVQVPTHDLDVKEVLTEPVSDASISVGDVLGSVEESRDVAGSHQDTGLDLAIM